METEAAITIKDVADLLFAARGRIDYYWNFYIVVVIGVITWLTSVKKPFPPSMKALVSIAYVIAAAMSLMGLYSSYTFAEAVRSDLLKMAPTTILPGTRHLLEQHSYLSQRTAAFWVHLAAGGVVLFVIWFARFSGPEAAAASAATDDDDDEEED